MMPGRRVFAKADDHGIAVSRLLFASVGPPVLWALHLVTAYFLVTIECISSWDGAEWAVFAVTALLGAASVTAGLVARGLWRRLGPHPSQPDERDWTRVLLMVGMAGSVLFTAVIVLQGVAPLFVATCA